MTQKYNCYELTATVITTPESDGELLSFHVEEKGINLKLKVVILDSLVHSIQMGTVVYLKGRLIGVPDEENVEDRLICAAELVLPVTQPKKEESKEEGSIKTSMVDGPTPKVNVQFNQKPQEKVKEAPEVVAKNPQEERKVQQQEQPKTEAKQEKKTSLFSFSGSEDKEESPFNSNFDLPSANEISPSLNGTNSVLENRNSESSKGNSKVQPQNNSQNQQTSNQEVKSQNSQQKDPFENNSSGNETDKDEPKIGDASPNSNKFKKRFNMEDFM